MWKLWRVVVPVLLLALLASCEIKPSIGGVGSKLYDVDPSQIGMVVGSFGPRKSERRFSTHALLIRHLPTKQAAFFQFEPGLDDYPPDFVNADSHGVIFTMKLPAGRYEIFNISLFQKGGFQGGSEFAVEQDFSIPFTIEGGKVTYVGEYIVQRVPGNTVVPNLIPIRGFGISTGVYFELDDKQARDVAFARRKWPEFEAAPVISMLPDLSVPNRIVARAGLPMPDYLKPPK